MVTFELLRRPAGTVLALGLVALVAAACEMPDPEPEMDPPMEEPTPEPEDVAHTAIPLEPVGESGVMGEATVMDHDNAEVVLVVEVSGLPEEGEYAAHIHAGSCEEGGPVAEPLSPVVGLADGTGVGTTTLDADAINGEEPLFIQVHGADGQPIACGNVGAAGP
jgi:hypothetical protein